MPPNICTPNDATSLPMSVEKALASGVSSPRAHAPGQRERDPLATGAINRSRRLKAYRPRGVGQGQHGERHARDIRMIDDRDDRIATPRGSGLLKFAPLPPLSRVVKRLPGRSLASATPCTPTASRALFIIVNMQASPLFSSPIR